eukprot:7119090-Pyramimonas_sp.AAC.1
MEERKLQLRGAFHLRHITGERHQTFLKVANLCVLRSSVLQSMRAQLAAADDVVDVGDATGGCYGREQARE